MSYSRAVRNLCVLCIAVFLVELVNSQGTSITVTRSRSSRQSVSQTQSPQVVRSRSEVQPFGRRLHNHTSRAHNRTKVVPLEDKDKYYENGSDGDYEYEEDYDDEENSTVSSREEESKFIEGSTGIVLDHVDFVLLRLKHILMATSDNITDIMKKQKEEFKENAVYKEGWEAAVYEFKRSKRSQLFKNSKPDSVLQKMPEQYLIALLAYTLGEPAMYSEFNKDTRELCSGTHVDNYKWKSYFKLLHLAVQTLASSEEDKYKDNRRFLYRGARLDYNLKEGQVIAFQHFVSTSAALNVAEDFADKKTLFEFQGFYNGTALNIQDFSFYKYEKETLFSPTQTFKVDSIHPGKHYTRYVLVKHEVPSPCETASRAAVPEKIDVRDNSLRYSAGGGRVGVIHENFLTFIGLFIVLLSYQTCNGN